MLSVVFGFVLHYWEYRVEYFRFSGRQRGIGFVFSDQPRTRTDSSQRSTLALFLHFHISLRYSSLDIRHSIFRVWFPDLHILIA